MDQPNGTPLDTYARRVKELETRLEEGTDIVGQLLTDELGDDWCTCGDVSGFLCGGCRARAWLKEVDGE